jgi:hypothetical protein
MWKDNLTGTLALRPACIQASSSKSFTNRMNTLQVCAYWLMNSFSMLPPDVDILARDVSRIGSFHF